MMSKKVNFHMFRQTQSDDQIFKGNWTKIQKHQQLIPDNYPKAMKKKTQTPMMHLVQSKPFTLCIVNGMVSTYQC